MKNKPNSSGLSAPRFRLTQHLFGTVPRVQKKTYHSIKVLFDILNNQYVKVFIVPNKCWVDEYFKKGYTDSNEYS